MKNIEFQITDILNDAVLEVRETVRKEAEEMATETSLELQQTSPTRTKKYSRSWAVKEGKGSSYIVHNKEHYRLAHLLEFGHEIIVHGKALGRRTRAFPHIKKIEEKKVKQFILNVKKRLEK